MPFYGFLNKKDRDHSRHAHHPSTLERNKTPVLVGSYGSCGFSTSHRTSMMVYTVFKPGKVTENSTLRDGGQSNIAHFLPSAAGSGLFPCLRSGHAEHVLLLLLRDTETKKERLRMRNPPVGLRH